MERGNWKTTTYINGTCTWKIKTIYKWKMENVK